MSLKASLEKVMEHQTGHDANIRVEALINQLANTARLASASWVWLVG